MPTNAADRPSPSAALRTYLIAVSTVGGMMLAQSVYAAAHMPQLVGWLAITALTILAGCFRLRFASVKANIAIDDTFFISTALLFGPGPGILTTSAAALLFSLQRRQPMRRVLFNATGHAISMGVAAQLFFLLSRVQPLAFSGTAIAPLVGPLVAFTIVHFTLNSGLTAIAVGLDTRQSPIDVWQRNFRWLWIGYLGSASIAFCLILLLQQHSLAAAAMVVPLFAVFYLTLRATFGRLDDAKRHLDDMDRLYLSTVETLAMAIDAKDDCTHSHVRRVQAYAVGLARALGIVDEPALKAMEAAALLHDTGKLAVPEHILNKPGKLTESEFEKMKQHVDVGADILSLVEFPYPVVPIVRAHHENWDGSGYPRGIRGEDIPIGARILSVVDCFDALTSDRPYRRAMTNQAAIDILLERRGRMYDPHVVDTFIRVYRDISVAGADAVEHHEVLQKITQSRQPEIAPLPESARETGASARVLAFVSLARVASGDATIADVLALESRLLEDLMPGVTGAWFLPNATRDHLTVVDAFGPAAGVLRGTSLAMGERLTGWVAVQRQPIVNSDAALDLPGHREGSLSTLQYCVSVPLVRGDALVGVLTLYGLQPFAEDTGRLLQMVSPHLAAPIDIAAASRGVAPADAAAAADKAAASGLRLVSTR
jgi:putative nucleotidyltransferase with HDIG domain